jgi:nucleoside-diphosphate-sugar epimerase
MANQTILVTGAAPGSQGSTGWHIVRLLRERGLPVRAFVHTVDERSDRLRSLGAEVIQGDLLNFESVKRAMSGVRRAFFTYPVEVGSRTASGRAESEHPLDNSRPEAVGFRPRVPARKDTL